MVLKMPNFIYLNRPIHKNHLSFALDEELSASLVISMDGAIHAIDRSKIQTYMDKEEVKLTKIGYAKGPKKINLKTQEDFFLACAYLASDDEE
jgi:hypothetical protein